jgi:hypothetical protein
MKFLLDADLPQTPELKRYRETAWRHLVAGVVFAGLALGAALFPILSGLWAAVWIDVACGVGVLLFGFLTQFGFRMFSASRRPESWIMRWSSKGIFLRFRSPYNHRFDPDTPSVVFLEPREVSWIRRRATRLEAPDETGHWTRERKLRGLEIGLRNVDTGPLAAVLKDEAQRRDSRGVRANDYPVTLGPDRTIRLEMRTPEVLLQQLAPYYSVGLAVDEDAKRFHDMSPAEKEDHVLALAQAGQTIDAVKAAREHYGYDLTEAKQRVDALLAR